MLETTEEVSPHRVKQRVKRRYSQRSAPGGREKPRAVRKKWEKGLANLCYRKKIAKTAHVGRGQQTRWEISIKTYL